MPQKQQAQVKENLQRALDSKSLDTKLFVLDCDSDALNLLYKISQHKLVDYKYNELRPYLVADKYDYEPYSMNVRFSLLIQKYFFFFCIK